MSGSEAVVKCETAGGIARIHFNRPKQLNAVNMEVAELFCAAVEEATGNPTVRVIVLSGEGRAFVAGGDLSTFKDATDRPQAVRSLIETMHRALRSLVSGRQIVIARVQGAVAGAGVSIALCSDFVVAASNASFNMGYLKIGASPDCGATWMLPRLVGLRRGLEIALLSETIGAEEALRLGLVSRLVRLDDLDTETERLAAQLAAGPAVAYGRTKRLMRTSFQYAFEEQLDFERDGFVACAETNDFSEALDAFFAKRQPVFGP